MLLQNHLIQWQFRQCSTDLLSIQNISLETMLLNRKYSTRGIQQGRNFVVADLVRHYIVTYKDLRKTKRWRLKLVQTCILETAQRNCLVFGHIRAVPVVQNKDGGIQLLSLNLSQIILIMTTQVPMRNHQRYHQRNQAPSQ